MLTTKLFKFSAIILCLSLMSQHSFAPTRITRVRADKVVNSQGELMQKSGRFKFWQKAAVATVVVAAAGGIPFGLWWFLSGRKNSTVQTTQTSPNTIALQPDLTPSVQQNANSGKAPNLLSNEEWALKRSFNKLLAANEQLVNAHNRTAIGLYVQEKTKLEVGDIEEIEAIKVRDAAALAARQASEQSEQAEEERRAHQAEVTEKAEHEKRVRESADIELALKEIEENVSFSTEEKMDKIGELFNNMPVEKFFVGQQHTIKMHRVIDSIVGQACKPIIKDKSLLVQDKLRQISQLAQQVAPHDDSRATIAFRSKIGSNLQRMAEAETDRILALPDLMPLEKVKQICKVIPPEMKWLGRTSDWLHLKVAPLVKPKLHDLRVQGVKALKKGLENVDECLPIIKEMAQIKDALHGQAFRLYGGDMYQRPVHSLLRLGEMITVEGAQTIGAQVAVLLDPRFQSEWLGGVDEHAELIGKRLRELVAPSVEMPGSNKEQIRASVEETLASLQIPTALQDQKKAIFESAIFGYEFDVTSDEQEKRSALRDFHDSILDKKFKGKIAAICGQEIPPRPADEPDANIEQGSSGVGVPSGVGVDAV